MYLAIGGDKVLRTDDIIGIFDTDSATVSKHSRALLNSAQKENRVEVVSDNELPRSFILYREKKEIRICLSPISAKTLIKRI